MGATYDPDNDAQKLQEELDQSMLLNVNEFEIGDINDFSFLKAETTGTSTYEHIEPYEETNNTHACMYNIRSHFFSDR